MSAVTDITFAPRILFLSTMPGCIEQQLANPEAPLRLAQAGELRSDVSTDEITPLPIMVHFDATLGRYPYTGLKVGQKNGTDHRPIVTDAIAKTGIEVVVAGERYGKGSSREHSVVAERSAGVRLVIARSFERIYRQNADNLGLFTSTDFSLIERIQRGEPIALDELLQGRDALAASILRSGDLLNFGQLHLQQREELRQAQSERSHHPAPQGQTLFEKIIARHTLATAQTPAQLVPGAGGFVRADWRFIHEYYTGMCAHMLGERFGAALKLHEPQHIIAFEDHLSYVHQSPAHQGTVSLVKGLSKSHRQFAKEHGLIEQGYVRADLEAGDSANTGSQGISHALMAEQYALPGQVVVGTDSHTPHIGALGCVAFGVGTTDMANAFVTGAVRLTMPRVLRVNFNGTLPAGVTAKDMVLHLLALPEIRQGAGVGKVFEFDGTVTRALSIDERATLTNMTAELGGFTGIVSPDAKTVDFLRERRGIAFELQDWMHSDPGASYERVIDIDCNPLSPFVARPGDPGNGLPLAALPAAERPAVNIAYAGSCTAGKREDFDHYHAVLAWAAARGLRVPAHVKLYLQFGTQAVRDYCIAQGYMTAFEAVGAELLHPACGACANCGPGSSTLSNEVTISAINRNFPGRSGPGQVWLASPPTVVASAIAGQICSFEELQQSGHGT
jgi:3-isopropylmalate/(R)-2-methylmalate dehydratase large subunit